MGTGYSNIAVASWMLDGSRHFGKRGFEASKATWSTPGLDFDFKGKVACVTGANSGIGYSTAEILASKNATVHLICRNENRGRDACNDIIQNTGNDKVHLHIVDVSSYGDIKKFASTFQDECPKIDILINNAMVMPAEKSVNEDGNELCLATMLGGSYLLTTLMIPQLLQSSAACVINVTSGGMYTVKARVNDLNCNDMEYDPVLVYAFTKRVQVHLSDIMSAKLSTTPIKVHSMHPGWVSTSGLKKSMPDFYEKNKDNLRTQEEGADTIIWLASNPDVETGQFWFDRKARKSHYRFAKTHLSADETRRLWENIQHMCGHQWEEIQ